MKRFALAVFGVFLIGVLQPAGADPDQENLLQRAEQAFAKGNYYVAGWAYQRLLFHDASNPKLMLRLAQCHLFSERPEVAKRALLRMSAKGHDRSGMAMLLGDIHMQDERWAAARAQFKKAIRIDDKDAGAYLRLGDVLSRLNDTKEADAAYEAYRQLTSNEP